jgi:hypothetical protein
MLRGGSVEGYVGVAPVIVTDQTDLVPTQRRNMLQESRATIRMRTRIASRGDAPHRVMVASSILLPPLGRRRPGAKMVGVSQRPASCRCSPKRDPECALKRDPSEGGWRGCQTTCANEEVAPCCRSVPSGELVHGVHRRDPRALRSAFHERRSGGVKRHPELTPWRH